ncbi:MAG: acyl carrier protein [Planctomycetaceae bacterium]|nr:acyl carrier protein [Planctomycetaceae bacterium]
MTDREQLRHELAAWISEILISDVDPDREDAAFIDDYGADSMDIVDIVEKVERTYDVTITNAQVATVRTFGDLVDLILAG